MATYTVEVPDGVERGITVRCEEHGEREHYQPGYRTVAFFCPGCGTELEIGRHDPDDWRDLAERC